MRKLKNKIRFLHEPDKETLFYIQFNGFPRANFPNHLGKWARIWKTYSLVDVCKERISTYWQGFGKYVFQINNNIHGHVYISCLCSK